MPPSNIDNKTEYRELDLTKVEDLNMFFDNVDDVYTEADQYKESAELDGYKSLAEDDVAGDEVFTTLIQKRHELQDLIKASRDKVSGTGGEIEDNQVEQMQTLYNDLILLRNHIRDTYENFVPEPEPVEKPVQLFVADTSVDAQQTTDEDEDSVANNEESLSRDETEIVKVSWSKESDSETTKESRGYTNESLEVTKDSSEQNKQDNKNLFEPTESVLKKVESKIEDIRGQADSFVSSDEITDEQNENLAELDKCMQRVEDLKGRVESCKEEKEDELVLTNNLNRYARVAAGIERKADSVLRTLTQKQNPPSATKDNEKVLDSKPGSDLDQEEETIKLTPEVSRKTMEIVSDSDTSADNVVPISFRAKVADKAEERLERKSAEPILKNTTQGKSFLPHKPESLVVDENDIPDNVSVTAKLESEDVINRAVPNNKVRKITHPKLVHEQKSLTRKYLDVEPYASFIRENYSSAKAFEKMLDSVVTQIENETVSTLERWLKEEFTSPFEYIQDMTVRQVEELSSRAEIKEILLSKNIKYESFVKWVDMIEEMQSFVGVNPDIKFGELYAIWITEEQMAYTEETLATNEERLAA